MRRPFLILEEETKTLANHHARYLEAARRHHEALVEKLEAKGLYDRAHLWQTAVDPAAEFEIVAEAADSFDEQLAFMGCYYCLQLLRMNLDAVDSLRLSLISPSDRTAVEREFMLDMGAGFRALSGAYMSKLIELFIGGRQTPRFVLIGVGTRADQDDIDVGVIDDGGPGHDVLDEAISRMNGQMLRYATSLHFHLSEHVGERGYSATIPQYREALEKGVHHFVIVSELLGSAPILGDEELFSEFQDVVVSRYYHRPGEDQRWHVGYLRGLLGEIRSLIGRPLGRDHIHPKDDGLRMAKGLLSVLRTIENVTDVNAWRIIESLRRRSPEEAALYDDLERALSFLEVFRYMYQLMVVQDEQIYLDDEVMQANLARVAEVMGYRTIGLIGPETQLLVDYYEHLDSLRKVVNHLTSRCTRHLKETTVFADMFDPDYPGNVAVDFAERSAFFKGTTFWRDILELLEQDHCRLLCRYLDDLNELEPGARSKIVDALSACAEYAPGTIMTLIVTLARNTQCDGALELFEELEREFRSKLTSFPYAALPAIELFYMRPSLVNRYLMSIGTKATREFASILSMEMWDPEVAFWCEKLVALAGLHGRSSRFFRQYLERAGDGYPACLTLLDDDSSLRDISRGVLAKAESESSASDKKKRRLGDFYDLEFLRLGLRTLNGEPASTTDEEFTDAADTFIGNLFDICKREVDRAVRFRVATHDLLAVYATGGLGREQAYDDDFDLLVLVNTNHEDVRTYANMIIAKLNVEIIKRGTLPHYRLADHVGHYVATLDELQNVLAERRDDTFVDQSQALEARMIVGTNRFEQEFRRRIVDRHIFDRRAEYVSSMRREIASRHRDARAKGRELSSVKDGVGSLRDIIMLLLMYKAAYRLHRPVNAQLLTDLARLEPKHQRELRFLSGALEFFKNLRNAYRMSVGAEDKLRREYFDVVARSMGLPFANEEEARERLMRAYRGCTVEVGEIVASLAGELEERCKLPDSEFERGTAHAAGSAQRGPGPTWRGVPRREVPWYPTIDRDACNGCGACEELCSFGVLQRERDGAAVRVRRRYACVVGCDLCSTVCPFGAISFPGLSVVEQPPDTGEQ
ncbi:MAG: hypothetical protein GF400_04105 [Candidatus Eisenbacteria bacterium]|nr:hypothetical protein [Candidatus Eisenbacteria bacterium]